jgi:hypothetical protein
MPCESYRKRSKCNRIRTWFNRQERASFTPPQSPLAPPILEPSATLESNDRQRTKARYVEAAKLLEEAVNGREDLWGSLDFPGLDGELDDVDDSQFKIRVDSLLESNKNRVKDRNTWAKCGHTIECFFTAFSPFAKNFLTIAKEGSAVNFVHILYLILHRYQY